MGPVYSAFTGWAQRPKTKLLNGLNSKLFCKHECQFIWLSSRDWVCAYPTFQTVSVCFHETKDVFTMGLLHDQAGPGLKIKWSSLAVSCQSLGGLWDRKQQLLHLQAFRALDNNLFTYRPAHPGLITNQPKSCSFLCQAFYKGSGCCAFGNTDTVCSDSPAFSYFNCLKPPPSPWIEQRMFLICFWLFMLCCSQAFSNAQNSTSGLFTVFFFHLGFFSHNPSLVVKPITTPRQCLHSLPLVLS